MPILANPNIEHLRTASYQDIFDTAYALLVKQGRRSTRTVDGEAACAYRGRAGNKCTIGHFIEDKFYSREFECKDVYGLPLSNVLKISDPDRMLFLKELQRAHDWETPASQPWVTAFKARMANLAKIYNLVSPV